MVTILHGSDLQAGKPYRPRAADALVDLAHALAPDVVVISGDLTQRAKVREFETVRALLAELPAVPTVLTPGNHDVPLYRFWERSVDPFRNWHRFFGPELDTVTTVAGATFVALNSAAPRRAIVNGRVDPYQVEFARDAFRRAPEHHARVLVVHHHLLPVPGNVGGPPVPGGESLVEAFGEMGVDLVLGGHIHRLRVIGPGAPSDAGAGLESPLPLVTSGTTTSRRGRGVELGRNSLNVIRVDAEAIEVTPYLLEEDAAAFAALAAIRFARRTAPAERSR